MRVKKLNEFIDNEQSLEESKSTAIKALASLGKHASLAIVQYLADNPDVITDVFDNLKNSGDSKVSRELSKL